MRSHRKRLKKADFARRAVVGLLWVAVGWLVGTEVAIALPEIERVERGSAAIRGGDGVYRDAQAGDRLELNEAVLPSANARVRVTCPNNTRRRVTPGRLSGIGIICPDVRTAQRSRNENDLLLLNGGVFPYVVRVVEAQPVLAWPSLGEERANSPANPSAVTVSVYRLAQGEPSELIWRSAAEGMQLDYAGPPLAVGETYGLVVEAMADTPPEEIDGEQAQALCGEGDLAEFSSGVGRFRRGACFRSNIQRLGEDEVAAVMAIAAETESLGPEVQILALAYRYAELGVQGEVVRLVAPLVASGEQNGEQLGAVYALLAESYLRLGHIEQAELAYRKAEELAVRAGDYPTRLAANLGLAKVAAWQMRPERAVDYLWAALRDVSYVRDWDQADTIVQWLGKLE